MDFFTAALGSGPFSLNILQICVRLLCAMVVGMVIGMEREYTHRPAGMRTHILVALGACAVMITGQLIYAQYSAYGATPDPARLSAQVITGVGFLGAGTILREGANVKGLTTAASLWAVACLGIAAGGGYYSVALIGMVCIFVTLTIFEVLQKLLLRSRKGKQVYRVVCKDVVTILQLINRLADDEGCQIHDIQAERPSEDTYQVQFLAEFGRGNQSKRIRKFLESLVSHSAVISVSTEDEATAVK